MCEGGRGVYVREGGGGVCVRGMLWWYVFETCM